MGWLADTFRRIMEPEPLLLDTPADPAAQPQGMAISTAAAYEARRTGKPAPLPEDLFKRPAPPPGVLPAGMAMDDGLPAVAQLAAWGLQSVFHEGLAFPGYQYLAELAQRAEYRHISQIWAEHATRRWVKLHGKDDERTNRLAALLAKYKVREAFREAALHDGLFGRGQIYLDFETPDESGTPLPVTSGKIDPTKPLKRLLVIEPMWSYPGPYEAQSPLDYRFYRPSTWYVQGQAVDMSRLLMFVGNEVPDMLKPSYAFGGLSRTQMAKAYVDNWLRTRQSVSDITSAFSTMVLETDMSSALQGGNGASLYARADMFNRTRDNRGLFLLDHGSEAFSNVAVPLSGLSDLQAQAQEQLASIARIPLSIYLQITPTGLNASTDGEVRSFYADVRAYQEATMRGPLEQLLPVLQLSLDGTIDETLTFEFVSLWDTSDVEKATTRKTDADTDAAYVTMGAISNEEVRDRLSQDQNGPYFGLTGDAPEPDESDDGDGEDDGEDA